MRTLEQFYFALYMTCQGGSLVSASNISSEPTTTNTPTIYGQHPSYCRQYGHRAESYPRVPESLKKQIRERDNYTCQICGKYGKDVDHIIPHDISHDNSPQNLRVLCHGCNNRQGIERKLKEKRLNNLGTLSQTQG